MLSAVGDLAAAWRWRCSAWGWRRRSTAGWPGWRRWCRGWRRCRARRGGSSGCWRTSGWTCGRPAGRSVAAVLEQGRGQTLWLALDETHQGRTETGARLGMLALRLVYRERAIPLAWVCYRPGEAPAPFPVLIGRLHRRGRGAGPAGHPGGPDDRPRPLLAVAARPVPPGRLVVPVPRPAADPRPGPPTATHGPIGDLAPRPGTRWQGRGRAFLKAGWRDRQRRRRLAARR